MYRNQEWYDVFEFSYDMSVPNVAHLEPMRGGCCTVMPYFIGKIVELPSGATPVDFAYAVHTDIGNTCVACRVNERMAPLSQPLQSGQKVAIITAQGAQPNPNAIPMGGYQQLVRGEPFRGRFRKSFEKPEPFEPGKPDRIVYRMPDVAHTFRQGHRIMVQVQSSSFPLTDRNPQKFVDVAKARPGDFTKATERLYFGGADGSKIELPVAR